MPKFFIETYGCSSNQADSEIIEGLLRKNGFEISSKEDADLIILNTCLVKIPTKQRMIHRIKELTKLKKPLIVAGCLPKVEKEVVERINSKASLIAPDCVEKIVDAAFATIEGKKVIFLNDLKKPKLGFPRCRRNPIIGIVQIGRGCLSNCSFCTEPYKGKLFSYPIKDIVKEIEIALKDGCKEIWISSLDNGCYGFDIGTNLPELLKTICLINGNFFVRVGMINPLHLKKIYRELVIPFKNEKIFKFLHLCLQSGSNKILEIMQRGYKVDDFLKCLEEFRKEIQFLTLETDIIVGHPGEDEKDFEETLKVLEKVQPDITNISKFFPHRGTKAMEMQKVPNYLIKRRSEIISEIARRISLMRNERWIGWEGKILVDEIGKKNTLVGRNFAYKPVVLHLEKNFFGKEIFVKIVDAKATHLIGEKIQ